MRVAGLVGFLVMNAVSGNPENGSAFERHGAEEAEKILHPERNRERPVRVQAMVAETDAEADRHPVKNCGYDQRAPAKHEQGGYRTRMQDNQRNRSRPVQALALISFFIILQMNGL
jgi:hypothetical protein